MLSMRVFGPGMMWRNRLMWNFYIQRAFALKFMVQGLLSIEGTY